MNVLSLFAKCTKNPFFGIDGWYKYLPGTCDKLDFETYGLGSIWLVLAGIIDALLRIGVFVAVAFFIFGAFKMVTSQGTPEGIKSARGTMVNAIIGLIIAVFSTWLISFILRAVFKVA